MKTLNFNLLAIFLAVAAYAQQDGEIENCYAIGYVSGSDYVGGISGNHGMVNNSYFIGQVIGGNNSGGINGANATYTNSFYNSDSTKANNSIGTPKTTLLMKNQNTYSEWDFESTWVMLKNANEGYPIFLEEKNIAHTKIIIDTATQTYDGLPKEPEITVINSKQVTLTKEVDYTLKYDENTDAGIAKIIITGIEDYYGLDTISFTIHKAPGSGNIEKMDSWYFGEEQPKPIVNSITNDHKNATFKYISIDSYTEFPNPGVYILEVTFPANKNYEAHIDSAKFEIWQVNNVQITWAPACGSEFIYSGKEQSPKPDSIGYALVLTGAGTNAESHVVTAKLADSSLNRGINLQNTTCPYTIAKKKLQVIWTKEPEYVYNKYTQGPTASISESGISFNVYLYSGAGKYNDENHNAPYITITSSNADNYDPQPRTIDYEILPKPLTPKFETTLPDFEYNADTIWVPSEVFQDTAALQQILDSIVAYDGFATDTVKKETDDAAKVLSGKAKVELKYESLSTLAKRVETTQKATATIITDDISADNYAPLNRSIIIVEMEDDEGGYATFCKRAEKCIALSEEICDFLDGKVVNKCDETPILSTSHLPLVTSQTPRYYTLKGILLGTAKPTAPGIYIEARGIKAKKIMVR
ncbi:MAG: hypothetical protein FWC26_09370 [Fibromonadales bacterium]|nr:hypothetical protein [Fibromonadales bacterium]